MTDIKRRKFVTLMGASATVIPLGTLVASLPSYAQDVLDPESENAKTYEYVAVSDVEGQKCANCSLYTADGEEMGKCLLFGENHVLAGAHCAAWQPMG